MVWNNIQDGDPGIAATAMQNWRHAGRFASDMVPLDNSGATLTTGLLKLGTAAAPWASLDIATGGAIYVGGAAFQGGGGGSSIEALEIHTQNKKVGYDYPISNNTSQDESFMDNTSMLLTLGQTHSLSDTTIYLDRDASTLSALNTTTGWTSTPTGTVAADATAGHSVNGTSVKLSGTFTNSSTWLVSSFTSFSLIDKNLKVWLYPDTIANATFALIRLESNTTTAYAEWQIPVASITAATLNSFILNINSPDTSTGAYTQAAINRIYLGIKSSSPQAYNWSWNYLRSVNNQPLKVPVQLVCDNATNQEFINITTATVAGDKYTLAASTTYSHTISSTKIELKQLDIAGGQGVIGSGTTGDAAKTGWDIQRTYMNTSTSGDLIISSRWYDENYAIATLTNASTTVLSVTTSTVKDGFKTGDVVRVYKWEYIDQNYQSPMNASIGSNFLDLTLTADATATSALMTLVHGATSNQNLGGDSLSTWRGIRVSADDYYQVEAATTAQPLIKATPTIWIPNQTLNIFFDNFNRADGAAANNWTATQIAYASDNANTRRMWTIYSNYASFFLQQTSGTSSQSGTLSRSVEGYKTNKLPLRFSFSFYNYESANCTANYFKLLVGSADIASVTSGAGVYFNVLGNQIILEQAGSALATIAYTFTHSINYYVWIEITRSIIRYKIHTENIEPLAWSGTIGFTNATTGDNLCLVAGMGVSGGAAFSVDTRIDDFKVYTGTGFIQKSTIPDVSGNKLITATRLTRNDATNQNPIVYQRNAVIS